jgi:ferredoxin-NAD(P)+ reductase (naphthalene dioxygenase ferredoxin-specific)
MLAATSPATGTVSVTVQPRGDVIAGASGALLLDTLRKAQIPISYSCEAGRCGTCRCEVLSGEVAEEAAEFRGLRSGPNRRVLACRTRLIGDCVIGLVEPDEVVVHPPQILKCRVESVLVLNAAAVALRLKPNRPLRFSAGQFARMDFGAGRVRPYSMANAEGDEVLEFHLRRVPDGVVSGFVAEQLRVGDVVKLIGPLGTSYLRRKHEGSALCIAGGTGLAPICSIVRTALGGTTTDSIHLYVGARSESELYWLDELHELRRQHPARLNVTLATDLPASDAAVRHGRVVDVAATDLASLAGWKVYLAGPPPMVDAGTQLALRLSAKHTDIHADAFYASEN